LETGADDYLAKPFEPKELLLRINNILNKIQKPVLSDEIRIGEAIINLKKLNIKTNKKIIKINPQERKILEKMLESPGETFSRNDIGKIINITKERTIDVMITRLRKKIEPNPKNPKYLQTIRGSGYVLWIK
jgi:two-component system phosphate regulon response regulator OmpR